MRHPRPERSASTSCSPQPRFIGLAIITVTALAPALGGSTELWAQAIITALCGLIMMLYPPRRSAGTVPNTCIIILLAIAVAAFLPVTWFGLPEWRRKLIEVGIALPKTRTPQPWLTLQIACTLFLALTWGYYLIVQQLDLRTRVRSWSAYGVIVLVLAAVMTISYVTKIRVPFWPQVEHYGFFPNRNHTSNVLGVGGIMIYAIAMDQLQRREAMWWPWLYSLALLLWALIIDYSRAGIVLLLLGMVLWHCYWIVSLTDRRRAVIAGVALVGSFAMVALVGGATLQRFRVDSADQTGETGRLAIQRDALALSAQTPFLGTGGGNFAALSSPEKKFFDLQKRTIHPESDVLWTAVELGWIAVAAFAVLFAFWLWQCFPLARGTERRLRVAALICVCAFFLHSFWDVPGHRLGTLWPALFLAGTAIDPKHKFRLAAAMPAVFRIAGGLLLLIAGWWFASAAGLVMPPTQTTLDRLKAGASEALEHQDYQRASEMAAQGISISPLDWELYFDRGTAAAWLNQPFATVERDFSIARYLLPQWPDLWMSEGLTCAALGKTDLAFTLWAEMLRRFDRQAPNLYRDIFTTIKDDADLVDRWRAMGRANPKCLLVFFQHAGPVEFSLELQRLLAENPELTDFDAGEKRELFKAWYNTGDKLELAEALRRHSDWEEISWPELARVLADYKDFRAACEVVRRHAAIPPVPESHAKLAQLELQARLNPTDPELIAQLCVALTREGRLDEAVMRLNSTSKLSSVPTYLRALQAELWSQKGEWQKAWEALNVFATS